MEPGPKGLTLIELLSPFGEMDTRTQEAQRLALNIATAVPEEERAAVAEALKELIHDSGHPEKYAAEGQETPGAHIFRQALLWLLWQKALTVSTTSPTLRQESSLT